MLELCSAMMLEPVLQDHLLSTLGPTPLRLEVITLTIEQSTKIPTWEGREAIPETVLNLQSGNFDWIQLGEEEILMGDFCERGDMRRGFLKYGCILEVQGRRKFSLENFYHLRRIYFWGEGTIELKKRKYKR
jgi:hypothetical protein